MIRRPPRSTRTDTRFPYTTLCRSLAPFLPSLCHGCRMPVSPADRLSPLYVEGVTCPACHEERDEESKARIAERQRQVERAALRGEQHIGREQAQTAEYRSEEHKSELKTLMRITNTVFCSKEK